MGDRGQGYRLCREFGRECAVAASESVRERTYDERACHGGQKPLDRGSGLPSCPGNRLALQGAAKRAVPGPLQTLLQLHLIRDRLHAGDGARHSHGPLDIFTRAYEAAQLNDPLERLNFDL